MIRRLKLSRFELNGGVFSPGPIKKSLIVFLVKGIVMRRMLFMSKLKPECVAEYRRYHENVWPELEKAYKEAGILKVSCFLHENTLLVYSEYDENLYPASRQALLQQDVEQRWAAVMSKFSDTSFSSLEFEEIYRQD